MRITAIVIGVILLALGAWVVLGGPTYPTTETPIKLGAFEVQTTVRKPVPPPLGYASIVLGGILIIGGALKKR